MATTILTAAARNAACDAITALVDAGGAGTMEFQTAASAEVATITMSATAFGAAGAVNPGECVLAGTPLSDTNATGSASAISKCIFKNNAGTEVWQCDVSTTAAGTGAIQLSNTTVAAGETLTISSLTVTVPE